MNLRTITLTLGDDYENVGALMDALSDFDGEARAWSGVTVRAVGGTVRIAAMAGDAAPANDNSSIGIESDEIRVLGDVDLSKVWVRASDVFGSTPDSEEGSDEAGLLEITGFTA